jgi:D-beta-D-heptose 7-phosphate kinase/D-beta-D-heptose 1-phosphate adenosyltransferase
MIENSVLFENLQRLSKGRVLCIGDVMLDKFVYGAVDRISPEAPIPVFLVEREKQMLGGAGNVVANVAALGAEAVLIAVVGDDAAGSEIQKRLSETGIQSALETSIDRFTTVKSRFVGAGQQMLRVDHEKTTALPVGAEAAVISRAEEIIPSVGAIILSDYGKGVLSDKVIARVIEIARANNVPVIVDPKGRDFARYRGATAVTPNRKELETATGMKAGNDDDIRAASMKIISGCGIDNVLATRSKDGMSLIQGQGEPLHLPSDVREVFDVSGAGDTVIAVFAAALASGVSMKNAAALANVAAGIVVGKAGTATVRPDEIADVLQYGIAGGKKSEASKVVNLSAAAEQSERWKARNFKVGFTNGCFDLLHPGHLSSLRQAKEACDYLIVAVNSDSSVRKLKGPTRPVQDETARASVLAALGMVDMVVIFGDDTPLDLIRAIKPDVLVKGGQYKLEEVVGYDVVTSYGGKVVRAEMEEGFSTTNTVAKIKG